VGFAIKHGLIGAANAASRFVRWLTYGTLVPTTLIAVQPAHADNGDQASAAQAVRQVYHQVQARCTPSMPPQFQSVTWDFFHPMSGGAGTIHDARAALG
jgi:hypothetical protein